MFWCLPVLSRSDALYRVISILRSQYPHKVGLAAQSYMDSSEAVGWEGTTVLCTYYVGDLLYCSWVLLDENTLTKYYYKTLIFGRNIYG